MRSGGVGQTRRNFTGQYLDETGLLFYHARYYDPVLGRFVSSDTIVPGSSPLTVWPGTPTAGSAWGSRGGGAANPQDLNRYTYTLNNPLKYTDPTGHCIGFLKIACGVAAARFIGGLLSRGGAASARAGTRQPWQPRNPDGWRMPQPKPAAPTPKGVNPYVKGAALASASSGAASGLSAALQGEDWKTATVQGAGLGAVAGGGSGLLAGALKLPPAVATGAGIVTEIIGGAGLAAADAPPGDDPLNKAIGAGAGNGVGVGLSVVAEAALGPELELAATGVGAMSDLAGEAAGAIVETVVEQARGMQ